MLIEQGKVPAMKGFKEVDTKRVPNPRVITLSPASLKLLRSVGALERMNHHYITPFKKMFVNESMGKSYMSFSHGEQEGSQLVQA